MFLSYMCVTNESKRVNRNHESERVSYYSKWSHPCYEGLVKLYSPKKERVKRDEDALDHLPKVVQRILVK